MAPAAACEDRYRLNADTVVRAEVLASRTELPTSLTRLADRAERLYERVRHLDRRMYVENPADERTNAVLGQMNRLKTAFGS